MELANIQTSTYLSAGAILLAGGSLVKINKANKKLKKRIIELEEDIDVLKIKNTETIKKLENDLSDMKRIVSDLSKQMKEPTHRPKEYVERAVEENQPTYTPAQKIERPKAPVVEQTEVEESEEDKIARMMQF